MPHLSKSEKEFVLGFGELPAGATTPARAGGGTMQELDARGEEKDGAYVLLLRKRR